MFILKKKFFIAGLMIVLTSPAFAAEKECFGEGCSVKLRKAESDAADELMLHEQGEIVALVHERRHELEYFANELSRENALRGKVEKEELIANAKKSLESIDSEYSALRDRFFSLARLRWRTKTSLVHRGLYSRKDAAAYEDRLAKLTEEKNAIAGLKTRLSSLLEKEDGPTSIMAALVAQVFSGGSLISEAKAASTEKPVAMVQLTVDKPEISENREPAKIEACPAYGVCHDSYGTAATDGAGNDESDGIPRTRESAPAQNASPAQSARQKSSSSSARPSEICGQYSGPYCGKSISEVVEMKREENDF